MSSFGLPIKKKKTNKKNPIKQRNTKTGQGESHKDA